MAQDCQQETDRYCPRNSHNHRKAPNKRTTRPLSLFRKDPMKKSSNISVTALHRFIPKPASGRSSELSLLSFCPCLAASSVWSEFWRLLRLHGLIFRTQVNAYCSVTRVNIMPTFPMMIYRILLISSIIVPVNVLAFVLPSKCFINFSLILLHLTRQSIVYKSTMNLYVTYAKKCTSIQQSLFICIFQMIITYNSLDLCFCNF